MSIYDKLGAKTASVKARIVEKQEDRIPRTGPGIHLDATARMHAAEEKVEELEEKLRSVGSGRPINIPVDQLREVLGRKRQLSLEEYEELKQNLKNNELVTPITVRALTDGLYEIISGHNRTQIFKELGKTEIPAVIQDTNEVQANLNAFYANLLHPNLPDYQKYLGFKNIQQSHPEMTINDIVLLTGKSRRHIDMLMKFDLLPQAAHDILKVSALDVGGNSVEDFVKLIEKGKTQKVIEALSKIASGELNQKQAVAFASSSAIKKEQGKKLGITIRLGRTTYCKFIQVNKILRLEFNTQEEALEAQEAVKNVLNKLVEERNKVNG